MNVVIICVYYSFSDCLHTTIQNNTQVAKPDTEGAKPQPKSAQL